MKKRAVKKRINPWLYWTPRVLTILFIIFIGLFSLDIFGNNYSFWETVVGLFMHNILTLILIAFLIIAWKWEWLGTVGFFLFGIGYILILFMNKFEWYMISWSLIVAVPAIIIGILWWINWINKK